MFFKNLQIWFNVIQGQETKRHFWHALTPLAENVLSSPWKRTYSRYAQYKWGVIDPISYVEWLTTHYWD